jgi:hypothetical protein
MNIWLRYNDKKKIIQFKVSLASEQSEKISLFGPSKCKICVCLWVLNNTVMLEQQQITE